MHVLGHDTPWSIDICTTRTARRAEPLYRNFGDDLTQTLVLDLVVDCLIDVRRTRGASQSRSVWRLAWLGSGSISARSADAANALSRTRYHGKRVITANALYTRYGF